jgi:uncharacterized sporulation protein YeaH/YhbH (DUF444 family)
MHIVDRRLNPKAKSLGNRQRFLRRARGEVREAVREALKKRKVAEIDGGEKIKIRTKGLKEPSFRAGRNTGERDLVLPGNREYVVGDSIRKPESGGGGRGAKGSPDGEGEDDFVFSLSREEFLDIFFEDLKLPNLIKARLKDMKSPKSVRAGFVTAGPPARLNLVRTMRNSMARRVALRRPSDEDAKALEAELAEERAKAPPDAARIAALEEQLRHLLHVRRTIAYIDPIDLKFNRFDKVPRPATQAVMFCLMDVSASMTEPLKDLAKRFFMLLHVFLTRHYREVDVVFIRHTTEAKEVDEESFFKDTETGGTVISSALEEMQRVIAERYPVADWNIYAAQASDGHNFDDDMDRTCELLKGAILPLSQYFAYIEVSEPVQGRPRESIVWSAYSEVAEETTNFAMQRAASPADIYPVFRALFSSTERAA